MNKINNIYLIILLSFLIKIFAFFYVGDERIMNEWSYIIHNYNFSGTLGYNVVISEFDALPMYAQENDTVLPTAFMPPLYFFYIYILQSLSFEIFDLSKLLIFSQIILSSISIFYLHQRKFHQ